MFRPKSFFLTLVFVILLGLSGGVVLWGVNEFQNFRTVDAAPQTPTQVVEGFYRWYLGYPGNPMVDRAYREHQVLASGFVQEIDALLASPEGGRFDPFLLAQDVPERVAVVTTEQSGTQAQVTLRQWWGGNDVPRDILITLHQTEDRWQVTAITLLAQTPVPSPTPVRPSPTKPVDMPTPTRPGPVATVETFYNWYLTYIGERNTPEMRNPLSDGAYREHPALSPALIARIDALAEDGAFAYDPFLCAQDIPLSLTVVPLSQSETEAQLLVQTSFEDHVLTVTVRAASAGWQLDHIACSVSPAEAPPASTAATATPPIPANWQSVRDPVYDFALSLPPDWLVQPVELRYPELDAPVVQLWHLLPQSMAAQLPAAGPPDPTRPPVVAPLAVAVVTGSLADYHARYAAPVSTEVLDFDGQTVHREVEALGTARQFRYAFPHPARPELWIVVIDQLSGFPERANARPELLQLLPDIIHSVELSAATP